MSAGAPLLVELGCEELPARSLKPLAEALASGLVSALREDGFAVSDDGVELWYTPRRLAARVAAVAAQQAERIAQRRGPAVETALDAQGRPTPALLGFARSCGVSVEALQREPGPKGDFFVFRQAQPGQPLAQRIGLLLPKLVAGLPVAKPMRWGTSEEAFIRPLLWLVVLHGAELLPVQVFGRPAGRSTRGHRFEHPDPIELHDALDYEQALRAAGVEPCALRRQASIRADLDRIAAEMGAVAVADSALVEEVAALTEQPVPIVCSFDEDFLRVPAEALVMTMESHQKFFAIRDRDGRLTRHFVGFANIASRDPAVVRAGYERVIRPRFADARFFYDSDLAEPLGAHQATLRAVTYQHKLGSLWDKSQRVAALAEALAAIWGLDGAVVRRAAELSRCDLMTRMVGEFPELQGTMGRYYATAQGESAELAAALESFYAPRQAGDAIPGDALGQALGVADRLDTLAGIFAVGLKPSGSKDPFALRRCALGLARILIESGVELDLYAWIQRAIDALPAGCTAQAAEIHGFVLDRLRGYFVDRGIAQSVLEAVMAVDSRSLTDLCARAEAVQAFSARPEASALAAANKRIGNLLRKAAIDGDGHVDPQRFEAPAEHALYAALEALRPKLDALLARRDYLQALEALATLRAQVDAYFESVMVLCEDTALRSNRLRMLARLSQRFLAIADIGLLQLD